MILNINIMGLGISFFKLGTFSTKWLRQIFGLGISYRKALKMFQISWKQWKGFESKGKGEYKKVILFNKGKKKKRSLVFFFLLGLMRVSELIIY